MFILHIREIKDSDNPSCCTNNRFLSPAGNLSPVPTLMWEPAHSPPGTVSCQAEYPSFCRIQVKGDTALIGVYDYLCQRMTMVNER
jgi:hypothetical protein